MYLNNKGRKSHFRSFAIHFDGHLKTRQPLCFRRRHSIKSNRFGNDKKNGTRTLPCIWVFQYSFLQIPIYLTESMSRQYTGWIEESEKRQTYILVSSVGPKFKSSDKMICIFDLSLLITQVLWTWISFVWSPFELPDMKRSNHTNNVLLISVSSLSDKWVCRYHCCWISKQSLCSSFSFSFSKSLNSQSIAYGRLRRRWHVWDPEQKKIYLSHKQRKVAPLF